MEELKAHVRAFEDYRPDARSDHFFHGLAFNVVPQVDRFEANGYTREEMKVVWEIRKVLAEPSLAISTTAVRVPTLRSHAESLCIRFRRPVKDLAAVRALLARSPGVEVRDDPVRSLYPMPATSTYKHAVEVGRIRHNLIHGDFGIDMFVSGDQLLRGAALNAFEILRLIESRGLLKGASTP
jgi:aspartate-semialdehyde dehydrogenase